MSTPVQDSLEFVQSDGTSLVLLRQEGVTGRWMPPVRMLDDEVPGQDGSRLRDVRFTANQVVVPILLDTSGSPVAHRERIRSLARALNPKTPGRLRSTFDGQVRELHCRYLDGMGFDEVWDDLSTPTLLFRAFDPFWYDPTPMTSTFTTGADGGYPDVYEETYAGDSGAPPSFLGNPFLPLRLSSDVILGQQSVVNDGDVEAWPVWTVAGPANSVLLENVTTGERIDLPVVLLAGQSVIIDTRPFHKTIRRDDGTNLFGSLTATSALWPLGQGTVNIRTEVPGATSETFVTLVFLRRWLSP